jgi:hypothetical protein
MFHPIEPGALWQLDQFAQEKVEILAKPWVRKRSKKYETIRVCRVCGEFCTKGRITCSPTCRDIWRSTARAEKIATGNKVKGLPWTAEEIEKLSAWIAEKKPYKQLANEMDRGYEAIRTMAVKVQREQ